MKISCLIFSLLLSIQFAYGKLTPKQKRDKLINLTKMELNEYKRLAKQTGARNPTVLVKMAELFFSLARLEKEVENEAFLKVPPEKRKRINKKLYFKKSNNTFLKAQKTGKLLLKKFKNFKGKDFVYFILAFNAIEFGQEAEAKKYFGLATKFAKKDSEVYLKSNVKLGELYYNKKNYKRAVVLYERGLARKVDRWWTKDAHNLAWCYLNNKKYTKAINTLHRIDVLSKKKNYVDMSYYVERDIGHFYVRAGRTEEGVQWYKDRGGNVAEKLFKVGKYLATKGKSTMAEKIMSEALKQKPDDETKSQIYIYLLQMYDKFGKMTRHLKVAEGLLKLHQKKSLDNADLETYQYQVEKASATLQKQINSKTYKSRKKMRIKMAKTAARYFKILAVIKPKGQQKFLLATAESFFEVGKFNDAIPLYDAAFKSAEASKDPKIMKLAINSMMAAMSRPSVSKAIKDKFLIKSYENFVKIYPKDKKSSKLVQRMFNHYFKKGDLKKCEEVLYRFKKMFPSDSSTQEAMIGKIIDFYNKKKMKADVARWVGILGKKTFNISSKFAKRIRELQMAIKFEKVEKANVKGDKKGALEGYIEIYNAPDSDAQAKKNAAFNAAVLLYEAGDPLRISAWSRKSIKAFTPKEFIKHETSFLAIASYLFDRQLVLDSAEINARILKKLCSTKSKNKNSAFKNSLVMYLAEGKFKNAQSLISAGFKCKVSARVINDGQLNLMQFFVEKEKWSDLEKHIITLSKNRRNAGSLVYPQFLLANAYSKSGRNSKALAAKKRALNLFSQAKRSRAKVPLEALDLIAKEEIKVLNRKKAELLGVPLKFPENVFNQGLQRKFKLLTAFTNKGVAILSIGSGEGIVQTYIKLIEGYDALAKQIKGFTPKGKPQQYIVGFKKGMANLVAPFEKKSKEFFNQARNAISSNNILSKYNSHFLGKGKTSVPIEYFYPPGGLIMDRGGKK